MHSVERICLIWLCLCTEKKIKWNVEQCYRILSIEYRIPSTEHRVLSTEYQVLSTGYRLPSTEYRVLITEYRVLSTEYRMQNSKYGYMFKTNIRSKSGPGLSPIKTPFRIVSYFIDLLEGRPQALWFVTQACVQMNCRIRKSLRNKICTNNLTGCATYLIPK